MTPGCVLYLLLVWLNSGLHIGSLRDGRSGTRIPLRRDIFSSPHPSTPALGPTQSTLKLIPDSLLGIQRLEGSDAIHPSLVPRLTMSRTYTYSVSVLPMASYIGIFIFTLKELQIIKSIPHHKVTIHEYDVKKKPKHSFIGQLRTWMSHECLHR